jgi:hypothetical protein
LVEAGRRGLVVAISAVLALRDLDQGRLAGRMIALAPGEALGGQLGETVGQSGDMELAIPTVHSIVHRPDDRFSASFSRSSLVSLSYRDRLVRYGR